MIINDKRALAYSCAIAWVNPIEGADNIELVGINGWTCIAKKGEFKPNDLCIYFEIDSKLPIADWSAFMEKKKYKVKTMKLGKFNVISQGLALPYDAFDDNIKAKLPSTTNVDVTKLLDVTYADDEDNKRKADSVDKYKSMMQRRKKIFKFPFFKWLMKFEWGRKIMFFFFGKKTDKKNAWPSWVKKTDEERVQNMTFMFNSPEYLNTRWIATEKIDGTSTTFAYRKKDFHKPEFYTCSRNVVFNVPSKKCFYDTNVYLEVRDKYNIQNSIEKIYNKYHNEDNNVEFITLQGETYGNNIQKRAYGVNDPHFRAFNLIIGYKNGETKRLNPIQMTEFLKDYDIPCVPIVNTFYTLPDSCEKVLAVAGGPSAIDGGMREGLVFRSFDGTKSFKAVDNAFLLKYHN